MDCLIAFAHALGPLADSVIALPQGYPSVAFAYALITKTIQKWQ
jgi:hypothetical protein